MIVVVIMIFFVSQFAHQHHGLSNNGFFTPYGIQMLIGFGFHVNVFFRQAQIRRNVGNQVRGAIIWGFAQ